MLPLSQEATELTGFTADQSRLYRFGVPVPTIPLRNLLCNFIDYLGQYHRPILVAHNAMRFDVPLLMRVLVENGLQQRFHQVVFGFLDTIQLSQHIYPGLPSYSLKALVNQFLHQQFDAHNAVEDAKILQMLLETWNPSNDTINLFI